MAEIIGGMFVDDKFSAIVEENLFKNNVLVPGLTYSTRWNGDPAAGAVKITKLTKGVVDRTGKGIQSNFTLTDTGATTLLTLVIDENFSKSTAIFDVQMNNMAINTQNEFIQENVMEVAEEWNKVGMDALSDGGTATEGSAITTANELRTAFIASRTILVNTGAKPRVMIANPSIYGIIITDGLNFTPETNERRNETGIVGTYYGVPVFEYQNFKTLEPGVGQSGNNPIDYILYDERAFAVATNLNALRVVDGAPNIVGVFSQVAMRSGFLVTNAEKVTIRTTTTA